MPKRSAKDAAETRERIIDLARKLFAKQGYADTSTAGIAKAAGVTDGALFHHFANKRDLFLAVIAKVRREFHDDVLKNAKNYVTRRDAFLGAARETILLSQVPEFRRIVLIEAPSVLGTEWRETDSQERLTTISTDLRALAANASLADSKVNPFALLVLGLLNETVFALGRSEAGIDVDSSILLLEQALDGWLKRVKK